MNIACSLKNALLLRSATIFRARRHDAAEKNLYVTDTVVASACKVNDLFLAFSAGACAMALAVMIVLTFSRSLQCN
jgi:hypothetical protein